MLALLLPIALAALSVNARPFEKKGLAQVVSQCNHDFSYTWDDGPWVYHDEIFNTFGNVGGKTTFYLNGNNWGCIYDEANVQALRRSFQAGHQIAHHSWSHPDMTGLTNAQIDEQIQRLDEAFVKILGVRPKFFRPPYGSINENVANRIQNVHGKTIVLWDADSGDSLGGTAQQSYNFYAGFAAQGPGHPHLTLSHEVQDVAVQAMRMGTVTLLDNAGINLVTTAQCLDMPAYDVVGGFGTRDSSWTCTGPWTPGNPPTPTCVTTYISQPNDNCASIGAPFGLSAAQILAANTFLNCNDIWVGTPICIPPGGTPPTSSTSVTPPQPSCVTTYISQANDNCASIGAPFGLSAAQILAANTFVNCNDIWVGTHLCIPPGGTPPTSSSSANPPGPSCVSTYHSVGGDTCIKIGGYYGLSGAQILAANTFLNCNDIWVGTPICIPPGGSACTNTIRSELGDTCDTIGADWGVSGATIKLWNDFVTCNDIWVNTPICVAH